MRLDQFVSQATGIPRATVQKWIRWGQVQVNGAQIKQPSTHILPTAQVLLDGNPIQLAGDLYLMFHKPAGVVSATEDSLHSTVLDVLEHPHRHTLHLVGRLDKDTTGLLLLTNDGAFSHRITAPKSHIPKTYIATLAELFTVSAAEQLVKGVQLHGEKGLSCASDVQILSDQTVKITIHEGKYHQVKRMFAAVGNHVTQLHRERIGQLVLDENLPAGKWRALTADELQLLT